MPRIGGAQLFRLSQLSQLSQTFSLPVTRPGPRARPLSGRRRKEHRMLESIRADEVELESRTLTLTQGQLTVTNEVRIDGDRDNNGSRVVIDGNHESRVLAITGSEASAVNLADLTITRGGSFDPETG